MTVADRERVSGGKSVRVQSACSYRERWHDREHECVEVKLNWGLALTVKMKYQRICNRKE